MGIHNHILWSMHFDEPLDNSILQITFLLSVIMYYCNPSSQEVEAGGLGV